MAFAFYQYNGLGINDGTNYLAVMRDRADIVPAASPTYVYRPGAYAAYAGAYLREWTIPIVITIRKADKEAGRKELLQYLDTGDPVKRLLSVKDGSNVQWDWYAKPISIIQEADDLMTVVMAVDNPWLVRNTEVSASVNIPAGGYSLGLTYTAGNKTAYPRIRIKPTSQKSVGYAYSRQIHIYNQSTATLTNYPFDIVNDGFDTATLVTASKMQADGDDLRVFVDGVEVDRWLQSMNNATTQVWVNLNLSPKCEATLGVAIADSGAVATITASTSITAFPSSGDLLIDDERFTYTGKNDTTRVFSGCTRAVKGTTAAAHTTTDTIRWIEHEIVIKYGDATTPAPAVDNARQPMFKLTSTNTVWDYDHFEGLGVRAGDWWVFRPYTGSSGTSSWSYTDARNAGPPEGVVLGITTNGTVIGNWRITHPAGVVGWNFTGERNSQYVGSPVGDLSRQIGPTSWQLVYEIPGVSAANTWQSWGDNRPSLGITAYTIQLHKGAARYLEASSVTLYLDSNGAPVASIGTEQAQYYLSCTISTGTESLTIDGFPIALNEHIEIDCNRLTVIHIESGASAIGYLRLNDETRMRWLSIRPGATTLTYSELGLEGVTMTIYYKPVSTFV